MKNDIELMNLYWTTSGIFPGDGEISLYDFKDRVEAAAKAGFQGIGIWHADFSFLFKKNAETPANKQFDKNLNDYRVNSV